MLCGQFHVPCARNAQFVQVADAIVARRRQRWEVDEFGSLLRGHSDCAHFARRIG